MLRVSLPGRRRGTAGPGHSDRLGKHAFERIDSRAHAAFGRRERALIATEGLPVGSLNGLHGTDQRTKRPSRLGKMPGPGRAAKIERALISAGIDAAASHDFTAALIDVATDLDDEASKRSKGSHWLCALLADAADAVDPAAIAAATGDVFADALIEIGVPNWAASVIGWGVAKAVESTLSSLLPGTQLRLGLRALGLLVCPSRQDARSNRGCRFRCSRPPSRVRRLRPSLTISRLHCMALRRFSPGGWAGP